MGSDTKQIILMRLPDLRDVVSDNGATRSSVIRPAELAVVMTVSGTELNGFLQFFCTRIQRFFVITGSDTNNIF
jgi:hypothetical protein